MRSAERITHCPLLRAHAPPALLLDGSAGEVEAFAEIDPDRIDSVGKGARALTIQLRLVAPMPRQVANGVLRVARLRFYG
jgi:hypothetical protein